MTKKKQALKKKTKQKMVVRPKVKGKGFYKGFLNDVGTAVGGGLGGLFGFGNKGRAVGSSVGSFLSKITGFGKYEINSNTLLTDTGPPVFSSGEEGTVDIVRREYVGDVLGSVSFRNNSFVLNPGNPALFPWLSNVASGYEQYRIVGMIIEYRPTSGSAVSSSNNALGTVIMSTKYDVLDDPFNSKQQMENYQYTVSTVPSNIAIHPIECKPKLNVMENMFVRQLNYPRSADPRFYDLGLFQLATIGMQEDNITVGELWVSYHVKFF